LLLLRNPQLFALILELSTLQRERQRDSAESKPGEEDANRRDRFTDVRPTVQRTIVGMYQQQHRNDDGRCHYGGNE
jgi:hypothetical protein